MIGRGITPRTRARTRARKQTTGYVERLRSGTDPLLEADHGVLFMQRIGIAAKLLPDLAQIFHVPNGGLRPYRIRTNRHGKQVRYSTEAAKLKAQGVRAGVPDYLLLIPCHGFNGLAIELKRIGEKPDPDQTKELLSLRSRGYCAFAAQGHDAAFMIAVAYASRDTDAGRALRAITALTVDAKMLEEIQ